MAVTEHEQTAEAGADGGPSRSGVCCWRRGRPTFFSASLISGGGAPAVQQADVLRSSLVVSTCGQCTGMLRSLRQ